MIIVIVSVLGLIGHSATQPLIDNLGKVAPGPAKEIFTGAIKNVQSGRGTAGILFVVGLAVALWSASGYIAAFMRASIVVWDVEEGRPIWKTIPIRLGVTIVTVILRALGGVVAFLVWLWITNVVILFGAELNAELERAARSRPVTPPTRSLTCPCAPNRRRECGACRSAELRPPAA